MTIQVKITERNNQSYITCIKDKTTVGYKYFDFCGKINLMPEFRGRFDGQIIVSHDEKGEMPIGRLDISLETDAWKVHMIPVAPQTGPNALYFNFSGEGQLEFKTFGFAEPFA